MHKSSQWLKYQLHIDSFSRMKIILFELWTNYIEIYQRPIWTTLYEINETRNTVQRLSYCIYIIVSALVKALERVQKLCCNYDEIFILAINKLSSACSMLITATFYVMGIDLNTLKTSHDLLISIAVIVKTYNSWEECCVVPTSRLLWSLKSYFVKRKYLTLLWTLSIVTLQMLFMLKQQHYTLTKVRNVKS